MLSLYFNNVRIPDFIKVVDISESVLPSFASSTKLSTSFGSRIITISYKVRRDRFITKEQKIELLNFIKGNNFNPSKLILPDNLDIYYMAKVTNVSDITGSRFSGEGTIEFTCFDFRGFEIESTISESSSNRLSINYIGTECVYPKININVQSSCTKIKIDFNNSLSSNYIEFNGDFKSGDRIILEQETNKVLFNGVSTPSIWSLNSKRNKLSYGVNNYSVSSGSIRFTVEFNSAFS